MKNIEVFSLNNNESLTKKVCASLKIKKAQVKIYNFADGEYIAQSMKTVRNKEVFVIHSTSNPVNDSIMQLLIFVDSLKRASVKSVTAIIPYYGYARQERKTSGRQPITAKLIANLIKVAGVDRVITFDLHASQIQGFFDIPVDNLKGLAILKPNIKKLKLKNIVIASPDFGGLVRARQFANIIQNDSEVAVIEKIRYKKNKTIVANVLGNVKNKNVILVDDIIDTGGSIIKAAKAFKEKGAKKVIVAASHAVLSEGAVEKLDKSTIDKIFITDSINQNIKIKKIVIVSLAPFIADVIRAISTNKSISSIYNKYVEK